MNQDTKEFLHSLHPILPDSTRVRRSERFEIQKIPCCTLLRNVEDRSQVLKLNDSGFIIWQLCEEDRELGEIVDLLADAYEHDREDMARDVSRVVSYLLEENALVALD